jgi:4-hydroxy-tetrahydrodipicolinate synthase
MAPNPIRGLWCATLTPLGRDGAPHMANLARHAQALFAAGVQGIAPFGTTGEGQSFSLAERRDGLDALLAAGIPPARILAATGCADLPETIALSRQAVEAGCAGCLVLPPFFFKDVSDDGLHAWYARLIEGVGDANLRVYLYHLPQVSAVPIPAGVARRLAADFGDVIAGVKDSGGDFAHTQTLLAALPGKSVLVGHEPHLPQLMRAGGAGTVCGIANLYPDLVDALLRPDASGVDEQRMAVLLEIVFRFSLIPALKAVRGIQTGDPAWNAVRPPLMPLAKADVMALREALVAAGFPAEDSAAR